MMKKFFYSTAILICLLILPLFSAKAYAGTFEELADTGFLDMSEERRWESKYNTKDGEFKIRFTKLSWMEQPNDDRRFHLIIWWNGERIADGYSPKVSSGYNIRIFRETASSRIFFALQTKSRAVLMGYDPEANVLHKYIDSKDYFHDLPVPTIFCDNSGDLGLRFDNIYKSVNPTKYRFYWDAGSKWFGYEDVTVYKEPETSYDEEYYEEAEEYESYESSEESVTPAPAPTPAPEPSSAPSDASTGNSSSSDESGELYYGDGVEVVFG